MLYVLIQPVADRTSRPGQPTAIRFASHGSACSGTRHLVSLCTDVRNARVSTGARIVPSLGHARVHLRLHFSVLIYLLGKRCGGKGQRTKRSGIVFRYRRMAGLTLSDKRPTVVKKGGRW
jgi:hypothetical protein